MLLPCSHGKDLLKISVRETKVANIDDTDKKLPDGVI